MSSIKRNHPVNLLKTIEAVETELHRFYGIEINSSATEHLVRQDELPHLVPELSNQLQNQRGSLLSINDHENVFLGVYISDQIIDEINATPCHEALQQSNLDAFCVLVEEISHFHLMMDRIFGISEVSHLEMEWQGEVDKVLVSASILNDQQRDPHLHQLFSLIYEYSRFLESLDSDRYREANHQAAVFWRAILNKFKVPFHDRHIENFKELLRAGYRKGWQGKISLMNDMDRVA